MHMQIWIFHQSLYQWTTPKFLYKSIIVTTLFEFYNEPQTLPIQDSVMKKNYVKTIHFNEYTALNTRTIKAIEKKLQHNAWTQLYCL